MPPPALSRQSNIGGNASDQPLPLPRFTRQANLGLLTRSPDPLLANTDRDDELSYFSLGSHQGSDAQTQTQIPILGRQSSSRIALSAYHAHDAERGTRGRSQADTSAHSTTRGNFFESHPDGLSATATMKLMSILREIESLKNNLNARHAVTLKIISSLRAEGNLHEVAHNDGELKALAYSYLLELEIRQLFPDIGRQAIDRRIGDIIDRYRDDGLIPFMIEDRNNLADVLGSLEREYLITNVLEALPGTFSDRVQLREFAQTIRSSVPDDLCMRAQAGEMSGLKLFLIKELLVRNLCASDSSHSQSDAEYLIERLMSVDQSAVLLIHDAQALSERVTEIKMMDSLESALVGIQTESGDIDLIGDIKNTLGRLLTREPLSKLNDWLSEPGLSSLRNTLVEIKLETLLTRMWRERGLAVDTSLSIAGVLQSLESVSGLTRLELLNQPEKLSDSVDRILLQNRVERILERYNDLPESRKTLVISYCLDSSMS